MIVKFAIFFALAALPVRAAEPPAIELSVGGGPAFTGPNYYVSIAKSGRLSLLRTGMPIVPPGKLSEHRTVVKLSEKGMRRLVRLAQAAGDDFSLGCGKVADGTFAHLALRTPTQSIIRECRNAAVWPVGSHTKALIAAVNENLRATFQVQ